MVDNNEFLTPEQVDMLLGSNSSMVDNNSAPDGLYCALQCVQIPLWSIITRSQAFAWADTKSSNSSMVDNNSEY